MAERQALSDKELKELYAQTAGTDARPTSTELADEKLTAERALAEKIAAARALAEKTEAPIGLTSEATACLMRDLGLD